MKQEHRMALAKGNAQQQGSLLRAWNMLWVDESAGSMAVSLLK